MNRPPVLWLVGIIVLVMVRNDPVASGDTSDQEKKEWIDFCKAVLDRCPYLKTATVIPFTTVPEKKLNGTVNTVDVKFHVTAFLGIDELDQIFTVQGTFAFTWDLPSCAIWPEAKDGEYPDYCAVKRDDIWHPVFYHANGVGKESPFDKGVDQITIRNDGTATWYVMGQFDASCSLSFKRFPFDEQTCSVSVKWQRPIDSASVSISPNMSVTDDAFSDTDVWAILNWKNKTSFTQGTERQVDFTFNVRRRPQAYVGNIFVPMILLMILQTAVFLMPAEMPDRSQVSITAFLSSAVLLSVLSASLPSTAETLGISVAFCAQTALGVGVTIYCLFTCRLAEHYEKAYRRTFIMIRCLNVKVTKINFYDTIAFFVTMAAYAVINLTIFCLMYETPSYSPFLAPLPPEVDSIAYNATLHRELGQAAADGRLADVKRILSLPGVDVNWWDDRPIAECGHIRAYSPTALVRAVTCNRTEAVEYLLIDQKAATTMVDQRNSHTLLITAILNNNTDVARLLLDSPNVRINQTKKDSHVFSALVAASNVGNFKIARVLVNRRGDVNAANSEGWTALMAACERGSYDIANLLVRNGADANAVDNRGRTVIDFAAINGNAAIVRLIWPKAVDKITDMQKVSALHNGALYGNQDVVDFLLSVGISANLRNQNNDTALLKAVFGKRQGFPGNFEGVVRSLIAAGAEIDTTNIYGATPLMQASSLKSIEIARLLLDGGADVKKKDGSGATPMIYAAMNGSLEMVQLLYDRKASINVVTVNGLAPFSWAADNDDSRVLEWLFNKTRGQQVNSTGRAAYTTNLTPLMRAAKNGREENVRLLLDNDADVTAQLVSGETAFGISIFANQYKSFQLILDAVNSTYPGVVNETINKQFATPLHVAAYAGYTPIFKVLLERGANVNAVDGFGFTPLDTAILGKEPEQTVRALLQSSANVNTTTQQFNWSPIMFAAMRGNATVVRMLLDYGADDSIVVDDIAPLHLAVAFGNSDATKALLQNRTDNIDTTDFTDKVFEITVLTANDAAVNFWPFASSPAIVPYTPLTIQTVNSIGRKDAMAVLKDYVEKVNSKQQNDKDAKKSPLS